MDLPHLIGREAERRRELAGLIEISAVALAQKPDDEWARSVLDQVRRWLEEINAEVAFRRALAAGDLVEICRAFSKRYGVVLEADPLTDPNAARRELESAAKVEVLLAHVALEDGLEELEG